MAAFTEENLLDAKVQNAPRAPGVYIMRDETGKVLYVGKAKDLKARIRAYFGGTDSRFMIPFLVSKVHDLDFIVTGTEKEALILENNLIKEHRPRYNVDFRDDKTYFNIRIDLAAPYPRFQLVRRPRRDDARYFGPYPSSASAKETLYFLQSVFPLRTCRDREFGSRRRPCLEYEIGRCGAPCVGMIDRAAYDSAVQDALAFLEGKAHKLLADLEKRMKEKASTERFEEAAILRDRLAAIRTTLEKQRIVSMSFKDQDIFGFYREGHLTQVCVLFVRHGKMVGQRVFPLVKLGMETREILSSLLKQFYDGAIDIPAEIVLPESLDDADVLAEWLGETKGRVVSLIVPQRGRTVELLHLAETNARNTFEALRSSSADIEETEARLAAALSLKKIPERIECFDISNIGGQYAVGSMVTFYRGMPLKEAYRRFRIRTVEGADDYGMMYEVLLRRFRRDDLPRPDLLMVDGGKGQLSVAQSVFRDLGVTDVDAAGIAKAADEGRRPPVRPAEDRKKKLISREEDRIYLPGRKDPVHISRWPDVLFLLQRVRDEAHRFAVAYFHKRKEKEDLTSLLDQIDGIGPTRRKALLTHFGDVGKIRAASVDDLQAVEGIGRETAEAIARFLETHPSPETVGRKVVPSGTDRGI